MALANKHGQAVFGVSNALHVSSPSLAPFPVVTSAPEVTVQVDTEDDLSDELRFFESSAAWFEKQPTQDTYWQRISRWIQFLFRPEWAISSASCHTSRLASENLAPLHRSADIPRYVLDYAPLVHLYSDEEFWPCDINDHLHHTTAYLNYTQIDSDNKRRTLDNLSKLNKYHRSAFLTSDDNVEDRPDWLGGETNIPDVPEKGSKHPGGRSDAPVTLVVVEKEGGIVDAFWFFFYSYNLGNSVFGKRFGNHVGDWYVSYSSYNPTDHPGSTP